MMHAYALIDVVSMGIASFTIGKYAYFSQDVKSKKISELLPLVKVDIPTIDREAHYTTNVEYRNVSEEVAFQVAQWKGSDYPTIMYHHGAAKGSYDLSFN